VEAVTMAGEDRRPRCDWGSAWSDPVYLAYHDEEWGVPLRDERALFELLCLEGAQAGLSWSTILHRRDGYRRAFVAFEPGLVAGFGPADVSRLLADPGIVRNRAKIGAAIANARAWLGLRERGLDPVIHLWSFVGGRPLVNRRARGGETPSSTPESSAMSRDLSARGFSFVGPTVCYALMQSAGLVNDHLVDCFRWREIAGSG
jgi:DNA-3-methyladenine glycosylase I